MVAIAWLFFPNILLPFPGATVEGIMKCCGRTGALIAEVTTYTLAAMAQTSITECCLYRFFVFYKMDEWLDRLTGPMYKYFTAVSFIFTIVFLWIPNSGLSLTYEELVIYAAATNKTEYVTGIGPTTAFIAFDLSDLRIIACGAFIVLFLGFLEFCNISFSLAVHRKVAENKRSLSKETYKLQRSLTYVLLAQALIPAASMIIPIIVYLLGFLSGYQEILKSVVMEWISVVLVGGYPLFNSTFCLYSMRPYRVFCKQLWRRVTCRPQIDALVNLPTSSTSGSTPANT